MRLEGQKVLITGGSAGIGLALARLFLQAGCQVAICGRDRTRLETAARDVGASPIRADLADRGDLAAMPGSVQDAMGGLSILVNNAGVQFNYDFGSTPSPEIAAMMDQEIRNNLEAPTILVSQLLPMLSEVPEAAVVNVSSVLALVPKASAPVYCATKAGLRSLSKALRYQFDDAGARIKVFEVLPPVVDTDMTRGRGTDKISPEDVAVATLDGMAKDRYEIRVAKANLLYWIHSLAPGLAERALRGS